MSIQVIPSGRACGAEIRGVDVSQPIDDPTFDEIEQAFDQHGVIFFRNQVVRVEKMSWLFVAHTEQNQE